MVLTKMYRTFYPTGYRINILLIAHEIFSRIDHMFPVLKHFYFLVITLENRFVLIL
jgi:hypothetical protein